VRDPATGLVPRALVADMALWNPKDTAADLFPFLLLAGQLLDPAGESLWLEALESERTTSGPMPRSIRFQPTQVLAEPPGALIFGASERERRFGRGYR
jgi:hypothetical protein